MTNITQNTAHLEAFEIAEALFDEAVTYSGQTDIDAIAEYAEDHIHEYVDGHEWTIYYHKAHQFCAAVDTEAGEMMIEDLGITPKSYNEFATTLAFWTLDQMVREALQMVVQAAEEAAEEDEGAAVAA